MIALTNARIYDYDEYHENYYIIFDEEIKEIGPMALFKNKEFDVLYDMENALVMPTFVCGHTHLYSAFARGMSVPFNPNTFKEVLKQLWWKLDHFLDGDMIYHSAFSYGLEQLKKGTTCLIDHHAGHQIEGSLNKIEQALNNDLGVRSVLAFETSDRYDVDLAITENKNFILNHHTAFTSGLFGLHASFTLSDKTLQKVKDNLGDAGIHIHVAESMKDQEDSLKKYHKTIIKRLDDYHLINSNSILVHCTHITEKDMDIIRARKATVAINVTSNMNNAVGLPDIKAMEEHKINMMIGNDGLIQSMPIEYLNTYYTAHLRAKNPIGFSLDSMKKMINNSYTFASKQLNIKLGRIKKGYKADFLTIPYTTYTPMNKDNAFAHIFFGVFPGFLPKNVFCNGKLLVNNYQVSPDLEKKNIEAKNQAKKLWHTIKKEGNDLEFEN